MPFPYTHIRIARPTGRLREVVAFYREGLGLAELGSFEGHAGYSGVMLGLPDARYHLEFTQEDDAGACPPPSSDNLLVFYLENAAQRDQIVRRLAAMGYGAVAPQNPYWEACGITVADPDGWRVVLVDAPYPQ